MTDDQFPLELRKYVNQERGMKRAEITMLMGIGLAAGSYLIGTCLSPYSRAKKYIRYTETIGIVTMCVSVVLIGSVRH
jgi:hypothetical protein